MVNPQWKGMSCRIDAAVTLRQMAHTAPNRKQVATWLSHA